MEKFVIVKDAMKKVKRFNLQGRTLEFKLKPIPVDEEPVAWVREAINQVIARGTENLRPQDQVSFSFCSRDFKRGEGWVGFRPVGEVTYSDIWDIISSVYQSNSAGLNTETFCLGVTSVRIPTGKGKNRARYYNNFAEECGMRRGIVTINNKDNLCLPRALVVAIAHATKDSAYTKVRKDTGKLQTQRARTLIEEARIIIPEEGCSIPELQQLQNYLKNYKIVVYSYSTKGRDVVFKGENNGPHLNLLYQEGHFNVITSLTAAFCCGYYCENCNVPYNNKNWHLCGSTCCACQQAPICVLETKIKCADCLRTFNSQTCYDRHQKQGSYGKSSVCKELKLCPECLKTIRGNRQHTCGEVFCKICNTHVLSPHLCYIQPDRGEPNTRKVLFIFYDLETQQDKVLEDGSLLHEANLCIFKQCCDNCLDTEDAICNECGKRLHILQNNPMNRFVEFVLNQRKLFKQVVVLAHNGQAFDHQFVLNHVLTKTNLKPELIMRGSKIILMEIGNVKFIDSLNYFPMALSKLPKAFGLEELKKGYFPHLFNTKANENYIGPLPSVDYYSPDTMKPADRNKFMAWYEQHKNEEFDMRKDLVEYCISDVEILSAACLKFRDQMLSTCNVCPFTEATTIASACNKVFRRNFLRPDTIGIIPKGGYRWRDNQSKIAAQWLVWEEHQRGINIKHAAKEQEAIVMGMKVDGYSPETKQVFEFQGCYYHGCPSCYKHRRNELQVDNSSLNSRYESTVAKCERLNKKGYEVIEMWECQFRRLLKEKSEIQDYVEHHPLLVNMPLNPRDAFYGGRTGNTHTYYKCKPGEKIKYVDVCSLYPYVCKYGKFPIGHPKVYVGDEECKHLDLQKTTGLIKCKILPPQDLYHPVLPVKMNNKLMFVLCQTCGKDLEQGECTHTSEERALTGVWCIDEVIKAIELGYKMVKMYEIWKYDVQQYQKATGTEGLFTGMMNKFIKVKQQASGWPKKCCTIGEKNRYIEKFLQREDVKLEFEEIIENPGLRCLAKLMLNSFWGKFGQRENQPKTIIINDPSELFNMLSNPTFFVNNLLPVNENTLMVSYQMTEEAYTELSTVNVTIASYVTTQARLMLYSFLEQLKASVLYFDTDSIIYVAREGEYEVPTGEFIGDMTDELECYGAGSYITEFVSGGPKNYAYKVFSTKDNTEHVVCKVKGISLNYAASQLVNFNSIKDMVLTPSEPVYITSKKIRRTKDHEVITREETKIYRPNNTKRKFGADDSSVPFGFTKKIKISEES